MADSKELDSNLPKDQKNNWLSFVKSISTFTGDLSALTAPSFILSPIAISEFPAYFGEPFQSFTSISAKHCPPDDPEERNLRVLKWWIESLNGQFTRREKKTTMERKPINSILGEQFEGFWEWDEPDPDQGGQKIKQRLDLVAEQVSHHPPVTAYFLENKDAGVSLQGHFGQKTSFSSGSIYVKQTGHTIIRVAMPDGSTEKYLISLPKLYVAGLMYGRPYVELCETSYIQSSTGYFTTIEYKTKGYFSGKPHTFKASIYPPSRLSSTGASNSPAYTIDGQWTGPSHFSKPSPGKGGSKEGTLFVNTDQERAEIQVKPLNEQRPLESRNVWRHVADGIRTGDFDKASREKSKIENEQRAKRKEEKANNETWNLAFFDLVKDDPEYSELATKMNYEPSKEESYVFKPASTSPSS